MNYLRVSAGVTILALLSSVACAETTWDVLQRFGFSGVLSISCKDAPSQKNNRMIIFRDAQGAVRRTLDRGSGPELAVAIDSAQFLTPTTINVRVRNDDKRWGTYNGVIVDVVMAKENNRFHTWSSKDVKNGTEYVKGGVVVSSGAASPWIEKCAN